MSQPTDLTDSLDSEEDDVDLEDVDLDLDSGEDFDLEDDLDLDDFDFSLEDDSLAAGAGDCEGTGDDARKDEGELVGVDDADDASCSAGGRLADGGGVPAPGSGVSARLRVGRPAIGRVRAANGGGINSASTTFALPTTDALRDGGGHCMTASQ